MTMPGSNGPPPLFVHEAIRLRVGTTERFVAAFTEDHKSIMWRNRATLSGIWETSPLSGHLPKVTMIWQVEGYPGFGRLGAGRHRDTATCSGFERWQSLLGEIDGRMEKRLCLANPRVKPVERLRAEGLRSTVVIQQVMATKPGCQSDYVEQRAYSYVPWSKATGNKWLGSIMTVFRYNEVTYHWALDGGWDAFGRYWPSWHYKPDAEIKSGKQFAPALRDGWEDSFLQSLPPNPLG